MKRDNDGMTMLRVLAVMAMVASCGDPGSYVLGSLPVTGGGGGQSGAISGYDGGPGGGVGTTGGGTNVSGGGSASAPCNCEVSGLTLTMSWECYVARFSFDRQLTQTCGNYVDSSMACGLTVVEFFGPQTTVVRDSSGAAVGGQSVSDLSDYVCPDNAALHALVARAGIFPDAGCSTVTCSCVDGGLACP